MRAAPRKTSSARRMIEHDEQVGAMLKKLEELGVADNTIVVYTTDNGNELHVLAGRRLRAVPRREGHDLGGRRARPVPDPLAREHQARRRCPTGCRATKTCTSRSPRPRGLPDLKEELLNGNEMNGTTYKVHLDGYNNLDYWTGKTEKSARREYLLLRRDRPDGGARRRRGR